MTIGLTYNNDLSRVQITASALVPALVRVERSTNQLLWLTVRGGVALDSSSGSIALDDYEFSPDVENFYRIVDTTDGSVQESDSITPSLDGRVWLKSIRYPFLNRPLFRIIDRGDDIARSSRTGIFNVVGRSTPVAAVDLRSSQSFTLFVQVQDDVAARDMDLALASGTIFLIQVPGDGSGCTPGGYVVIGTSRQQRLTTLDRWVFELPCTVVTPPGPEIVGTTLVWRTVFRLYGSWQALLAANSTWADLLATVGSGEDLVVL